MIEFREIKRKEINKRCAGISYYRVGDLFKCRELITLINEESEQGWEFVQLLHGNDWSQLKLIFKRTS